MERALPRTASQMDGVSLLDSFRLLHLLFSPPDYQLLDDQHLLDIQKPIFSFQSKQPANSKLAGLDG